MRMPEPPPALETTVAAAAGARLDAVVAALAGVSVNAARRLLADGAVMRNGRACAAGDKGRAVAVGDTIAVARAAIDPLPTPRPDLPLTILAQGDGWVAVDKPAGLAAHPLSPRQTDTVLNRLAARCPEVIGVGAGGLRSGVVHRLDLPTTGVLLFATDEPRYAQLREAFAHHTIQKTYQAIVRGRLSGAGDETVPLAVTRHRPARVEVVPADHPQARVCSLAWRAVEPLSDATLIEVDLRTGFLHQVRVMFAAMGHPLLGDAVYGDGAGAPRTMLHAAAVRFEDIEVRGAPPDDFAQALAARRHD